MNEVKTKLIPLSCLTLCHYDVLAVLNAQLIHLGTDSPKKVVKFIGRTLVSRV